MKKFLLSLITIFLSIVSFGQSGDPLRDKLDSIFFNINKTVIPTGYLQEYGSMFLPLNCLNGLLSDSNNIENLDIWRYAYSDL